MSAKLPSLQVTEVPTVSPHNMYVVYIMQFFYIVYSMKIIQLLNLTQSHPHKTACTIPHIMFFMFLLSQNKVMSEFLFAWYFYWFFPLEFSIVHPAHACLKKNRIHLAKCSTNTSNKVTRNRIKLIDLMPIICSLEQNAFLTCILIYTCHKLLLQVFFMHIYAGKAASVTNRKYVTFG